jgi:hypothetical protein
LASFLTFLILILLVVFSFVYFSLPSPTTTSPDDLPNDVVDISLTNLRCTDQGNTFEVCGDVSWSGGAYARAHIPGGEELSDSKKYFSAFTYCQPVGPESGFRLFRAFVYDTQNNVAMDRGEGVSCVESSQPSVSTTPTTSVVTKHLQFYTGNTFGRPDGSGSVSLSFSDPVLSCDVSGDFFTEDGGQEAGKAPSKMKQYCDHATGQLIGSLTADGQSVTVDADPFKWNGYALTDPAPTVHNGAVAFAYTCDTQYGKNRYYTSVTATGLQTPELTLDWYHKNDDTQPRLYFNLDFTCLLQHVP